MTKSRPTFPQAAVYVFLRAVAEGLYSYHAKRLEIDRPLSDFVTHLHPWVKHSPVMAPDFSESDEIHLDAMLTALENLAEQIDDNVEKRKNP